MKSNIRQLSTLLFLLSVLTFLSVRLYRFIDRYAVDFFMGDQWDYLGPVFLGASFSEQFFQVHGPHRMGAGLVIDSLLLEHFSWSSRAESFFIGFLTIINALLALLLCFRFHNKLSWSDIIIPLTIIHLTQNEILVHVPNISHGPLPLFFIILSALVLTLKRIPLQLCLLLALNFLLIFTGFGLFAGFVTPLLLFAAAVLSWKAGAKKQARIQLFATIIAIASLGSFFINYQPIGSKLCPSGETASLKEYVSFAFLMFNKFVGLLEPNRVSRTGALITVIGVVIATIACWRQLAAFDGSNSRKLIILYLVLFTTLFVGVVTYGRTCPGTLGYAVSSRYTPYLMPAFLAVYFAMREFPWPKLRPYLYGAMILLLTYSHHANLKQDHIDAQKTKDYQLAFAECYRRYEYVHKCFLEVGSRIHPAPQVTQMKEMLQYFKKNKYNLYITKNGR